MVDDDRPENGQPIRIPNFPARPKPKLQVPDDVLHKYNARVLDPTTALQVKGQPPVQSTVYVGDALLVSPNATQGTRDLLAEAAKSLHLELVDDREQFALRSPAVARRLDRPVLGPQRVRLVPDSDKATAAPDAFKVLQTLRGLGGEPTVGLDHLLTSATGPSIHGAPIVQGHGIMGTPIIQGHGEGSAQYAMPGWGGRQPVNWIGELPERRDFEAEKKRRPVVAVLDTGVGEHPWLPPDIVRLVADVDGTKIADPEQTGVTGNPYEGTLDPDAGHGTFIAGLIRQQCPDADILAIRIMGGDGIVAESNLLDALHLLVLRQQHALANNDLSQIVDIVSLSLGYYHEQPKDLAFDPQLLVPLQELGRLGVTVVVAAGNDATNRPCFPAAFAPWSEGLVTGLDPDVLPVISVGALNPNGTIALFSNAGDWVRTHRPGASLVSTFPTTIDAGLQPSIEVFVEGDGLRATTDPDDFSAGFAVWSGTSFAGPVLAGELAARLCDVDLQDCSPPAMRTRAWAAIGASVPGLAP